RAYGRFRPVDGAWKRGDVFVDPLRPRVFEHGFATVEELEAERERHLGAVRSLFETLDVFVFTLGLTEGFCSTIDGTAFPAAPGKDFGVFDPTRFAFRNLTVAENLDAMHRFIEALRAVNPAAKILLTVSPVPLVATMEDRSVIQSTVYSKSVLRVVADELRRAYDFVDYFWSYEIITATYNTQRYFELDRRSVAAEGVADVMRSFFRHFAGLEVEQATAASDDPCDEDVLHAMIKAATR
ncbi:MAG TPA: GSCFA domain-containing protein, partial [Candidatus Aquilonibacter sp.]|nr:GSCFA domain-containing protein [Candidatus Aquilonibacter sp.]